MTRKPRYAHEGIHHATINGHRFHLRLTDPTEKNFLWIDGRSPPLVLDQVAAELTALMIEAMWSFQLDEGDRSEQVRRQVMEKVYKRYGSPFAVRRKRVTRQRIAADFDRLYGTLMAVAEGRCPVDAGLDMLPFDFGEWAAPARIDLALTYRCNLDCGHCYTGGPREGEELSTSEWLEIYARLWQAGVPQIVFTGGEPLLRDDIVTLVGEADEFVTGLVTNGVLLRDLAEPLQDASIDYLQVTLESHDPAVHNAMVGAGDHNAHARTVEGIARALELRMEVVTNTTITTANAAALDETLRFGKELGLEHMACNTLICSGRGKAARQSSLPPIDELRVVLARAQERAQELGINLQWYTPTCYHELNPLELGFGPKSCSAAAHNMTIQPDGTVLPCQSWPDSVGHLLERPWNEIWTHPLCVKLRSYGFAKERKECGSCEDLQLCGGGCPLEHDIDTIESR